MIARALLVGRTARHLRWEQIVYRVLRRGQRGAPARRHVAAHWDAAVADPLRQCVERWKPDDAAAARARADRLLDGTFDFLGHAERLACPVWGERYVDHLWTFNLHYFDYARDLAWAWQASGDARYARRFEELSLAWIDGTRNRRGDGWHPYPTSLRVVNWIQALLLFGPSLGDAARSRLEASLAEQLDALSRRLELHILANHLQKNAFALYVGGLAFTGHAATRWARIGARYLWRELFEQVLSDGGHYERSPMYHAIALGDFLQATLLGNAVGRTLPPEAGARLSLMIYAIGALCRPDGAIHLFNDAAAGIAPSRAYLEHLAALAHFEPPPVAGRFALPRTGYFGFADAPGGDRILVDAGDPGPSYQPGHAHCDMLSFELDLGGRPVLVDAGVSGYDGDPLREYCRSTRAHNTVSVGGREQSEVWGVFRMARRARLVEAGEVGGGRDFDFAGAYRPFHAKNATHRREISREEGGWRVSDRVDGAGAVNVESFAHFHPDFTCTLRDGKCVARADDAIVELEPFGIDGLAIVRGHDTPAQGWHCPAFGLRLAADAVVMTAAANDRPFGYRVRRIG